MAPLTHKVDGVTPFLIKGLVMMGVKWAEQGERYPSPKPVRESLRGRLTGLLEAFLKGGAWSWR